MNAGRAVPAAADPKSPQRPFDVEHVPADFPILRQRVHGKPLVYLDTVSSAQKPQVVIDTMARSCAEDHANVHRGLYALGERATQA